MGTLTIRNVSPTTRQALKARAARHDRSMEAEVRAILEDVVGRPDHVASWLEGVQDLGGDDLELPERRVPREVDLA